MTVEERKKLQKKYDDYKTKRIKEYESFKRRQLVRNTIIVCFFIAVNYFGYMVNENIFTILTMSYIFWWTVYQCITDPKDYDYWGYWYKYWGGGTKVTRRKIEVDIKGYWLNPKTWETIERFKTIKLEKSKYKKIK